MSPKKHLSLQRILFPVLAISLFLFMVVQQSCKKTGVGVAESAANNINKTEQFFKLPTNANSSLQRVAEALEKQNNKKEFIEEFITKEGFAIWDKASLFVKADNANTTPNNSTAANPTDLSGLRDTTIFIPLVLNNANHVNAFIKAIVADTVSMRLFRNSDYQNFPFQTPTPPTVTTAENYALRIMQMDKDVFGHTAFYVKDKRLFNKSTDYRDTGKITRIVDFANATNNVTANGFTINSVLYFVCVTITTTTTSNHCPYPSGQCTGLNGTCDNCPAICATVTSSSSIDCDTYYVEETGGGGGGWPIIPTGGGGGGGGSQPPCPMGAIIINSAILPNCNPVPNPWPSVTALTQQLNAILQQGDSYLFQPIIDNSLNFTSVADFQNYLTNINNNTTFDITQPSVINQQGDEKTVKGRINRTFMAGEDIFVKVKKNAQNTWDVVQVTSDDWGFTLGWSWSTTGAPAPSISTTGNVITIDVYGYEKYNIFVEGIGTVYKKLMHYRVVMNKTTGEMTSLSKI